jgi:Kef-type K+ transport system membrane component KefB
MLESNLFLFLGISLLTTFALGKALERIRVPWIFGALLIGLGLAIFNPFQEATSSETFELLAMMGMYLFLFLIGFKINIAHIIEKRWFVVKSSLALIVLETIIGGIFVHYVFGTDWHIALYVAHVFATVGEAALLPLLQEFKLMDTDFGQRVIGVATADDVFEVLTILLLPFLPGFASSDFSIGPALIAIGSLIAITILAIWGRRFIPPIFPSRGHIKTGSVMVLVLAVASLFVYIGSIAEAAALGALLGGLTVQRLIPDNQIKATDRKISTAAYGVFGPIFFLWVGADVTFSVPTIELEYLAFIAPGVLFALIVIAKIVLVKATKVLSSLAVAGRELGTHKAILMGLFLSIKLSVSVVIIKLLFEHGLIGDALYSVLIVSKIGIKFILPFLLAYLLIRWKISDKVTYLSKKPAT